MKYRSSAGVVDTGPAAGIVSPMIPLAVSGRIVLAVAVVGALVLVAILLRMEG